MAKFEIVLKRTYSLSITREFETEAEAEEFANSHSWDIKDADDVIDDYETLELDDEE